MLKDFFSKKGPVHLIVPVLLLSIAYIIPRLIVNKVTVPILVLVKWLPISLLFLYLAFMELAKEKKFAGIALIIFSIILIIAILIIAFVIAP